jgi:hypothetical protein
MKEIEINDRRNLELGSEVAQLRGELKTSC